MAKKPAKPDTLGGFRFHRTVFGVHENGEQHEQEISIIFWPDADDAFQFGVVMPEWMKKAGMADINSSTLSNIVFMYEDAAACYSRNKLAEGLSTQLLIRAGCGPGTVTLDYDVVRHFGDMLVDAEGEVLYSEMESSGHLLTLIADTPEHRAKLDELRKSIGDAGTLLTKINTVDDPAAYLMALQYAPPAPPAPVEPEQPAIVYSDDDEI